MTPSARQLLERIRSTPRPLTAQHDYITSGTRYRQEIFRLTGRYPAIFGSDLSFCYTGQHPEQIGHCGPANLTEPGTEGEWSYAPERVFQPEGIPTFLDVSLEEKRAALVDRCIHLHRQGTFITLMWHAPRPGCGDDAGDGDLWVSEDTCPNGAFWDELFDSRSALHADWCAQVDRIAHHLRKLRDAGVPILWRPYHEMNGRWFWWGRAPLYFPRLWSMLYDRLTHVHQLDHLIWVWNPNAPRDTPGDEAEPYVDYYPGGDYVHVLAADVYHNDFRDSHHDDLLRLADGRPIALGEVGHLPTPEILARQNQWRWVMPWGGLVFRFNPPADIRAFYNFATS